MTVALGLKCVAVAAPAAIVIAVLEAVGVIEVDVEVVVLSIHYIF